MVELATVKFVFGQVGPGQVPVDERAPLRLTAVRLALVRLAVARVAPASFTPVRLAPKRSSPAQRVPGFGHAVAIF